MFPKEITNLYNELRHLTEEVKNYYAYHAVLTIIDSILIFISSATALTLDYRNEIDMSFFHNKLFLIYCVFKMLFLFFIVRETHHTAQEVSADSSTLLFSIHNLFYYNIKLLKYKTIETY